VEKDLFRGLFVLIRRPRNDCGSGFKTWVRRCCNVRSTLDPTLDSRCPFVKTSGVLWVAALKSRLPISEVGGNLVKLIVPKDVTVLHEWITIKYLWVWLVI
jgi:hypothetical protein